MLLMGVGAFVVMAVDVLAINHLGGTSTSLLVALGAVAVVALFVMSGATPAALGLLADVSEGFEEDRSAIMGLYSVFLGIGQVIGAVVGGIAASWKGIDGLDRGHGGPAGGRHRRPAQPSKPRGCHHSARAGCARTGRRLVPRFADR